MILRGIVGFFKTVISVIAKVIAWLLIALGLWLPAIYAVVFFFICVLTKTEFSSIKTLFYLGLLLTTAFSVWYTLSSGKNRAANKKKQGSNPVYLSKVKKREDKVEFMSNTPPNGSVFRPSHNEDEYIEERTEDFLRDEVMEDEFKNQGPARRDYDALKREYYNEMNERYGDVESAKEQKKTASDFHPYRSEHKEYEREECRTDKRQDEGGFRRYYGERKSYDREERMDKRPRSEGEFSPYRSERSSYDHRYDGGKDRYRSYGEDDSLRTRENVEFQPYHRHGQEDYETGYREQSNERGRGYKDRTSNRYGFEPYTRAEDADNTSNREFDVEPQREEMTQRSKNENPRIFLSRRDNTLLIYEYSDRLELYKKTERGLVHHSTKYKA